MSITKTDDEQQQLPGFDAAAATQEEVTRGPDSYDPGEKDENGNVLCLVIEGRPFEVEHFGRKSGFECLWWINEHELSIRHSLHENDKFVMTEPTRLRLRETKERAKPKVFTREYVDRDAPQIKRPEPKKDAKEDTPLSASRGGGRN